MEISKRITSNQQPQIKGNKVSDVSQSPFGSDNVQLGKKPDKFGLTQSQLKRFFTAGTRNIKSQTLWKSDRPGLEYYASIIPGKDRSVYARTKDGIAKLDGISGDEKWSVALKSPLLDQSRHLFEGKDGTVIAACEDNKLHGMDPKTGKEKWSFDLGFHFKKPVKVLDNGDILAFRKVGDKLHLSRLNQDGSLKNSAELGFWDKPVGDNGCGALFVSHEKDGNVLVHAGVGEKKPGQKYISILNKTLSVTSDGRVNWENRNLNPSDSFPSDPAHYFMTDYQRMAAYDKHTGKEIWKLEKQDESYHPSVGNFRAGVFEIDGEPKYQYIKFVNSQKGRLIVQGYMEGPLRKSKSGEELICMDPGNPDKIYWKKPSAGTIFNGPIYNDANILLHSIDEDTGTIEALDPMTGKSKWSHPLKDRNSGQRVIGRQGQFVRVRQENPDNYRVKKAEDGTLFIRTFKNIFGIEPKTGNIKYIIKADNEIGDFYLNEKDGVIFAVNNEDNSVQAFPIHSDGNATSSAAKRIAGKEQQGETPDLTIEVGENKVNIGGVSLPINKRK
ncbi:MAG: PQQ-like beta-propeller repeat protein [Candidatus Eremiobacteraeota bacterium]|nr:PQQ-like beta-propeller repeat protein [Candidatus Eremiobacteraeota bacterium]